MRGLLVVRVGRAGRSNRSIDDQVIGAEAGVAQDGTQCALDHVTPTVKRDSRAPTVGRRHDAMAATLPDHIEAIPARDAQKVNCRDGREPWTHAETRTLVIETSCGMGSPRSRM